MTKRVDNERAASGRFIAGEKVISFRRNSENSMPASIALASDLRTRTGLVRATIESRDFQAALDQLECIRLGSRRLARSVRRHMKESSS